MIVNLDLTALAVKKALEAAEAAAGVSIDCAYVGVAGAHIKGVNSRGAITLGKSPSATREVERDDMRRVIQTAQGIHSAGGLASSWKCFRKNFCWMARTASGIRLEWWGRAWK